MGTVVENAVMMCPLRIRERKEERVAEREKHLGHDSPHELLPHISSLPHPPIHPSSIIMFLRLQICTAVIY